MSQSVSIKQPMSDTAFTLHLYFASHKFRDADYSP